MKLILLGAPGSGKGTQAEILSRELGIPTISTGNILREAVRNETPIGVIAKSYIDSGKLVPDEVVVGIIRERLSKEDCAGGYILDGFPRTVAQAEALRAFTEVDRALLLQVPDEAIEARMTGRRTCPACGASYHTQFNPPKKEGICDACGAELTRRKDDDPAIVRDRLNVYHQQSEPLIGYYKEQGRLVEVFGLGELNDVTDAIFAALGVKR